MALRQNKRTALAHRIGDDDDQPGTAAQRSGGQLHCACGIDVLSGSGGDGRLSSRFLGSADELFDGYGGGSFYWFDQFIRQFGWVCWSLCRGLFEQENRFVPGRCSLSISICAGRFDVDSFATRD